MVRGGLFLSGLLVVMLSWGCSEEENRRNSRRGAGAGTGDGDAFVVGMAEVLDGDSLVVSGEEVRLLGIDAPEMDQACGEGDDVWNCGDAARVFLGKIVAGVEVRCGLMFRDAHKRLLSRCFVGKEDGSVDLGEEMVRGGMAVASRGEYRGLEDEAKGLRRGIWGGCLVKPERWRGGRRGCWHR